MKSATLEPHTELLTERKKGTDLFFRLTRPAGQSKLNAQASTQFNLVFEVTSSSQAVALYLIAYEALLLLRNSLFQELSITFFRH